MKKLVCLFALIFSLVFMNTSCKKSEDNVQPPKTLAEQFPDWTNLTWVSTNGHSDIYTYPKLNISIVDNVVNYVETETYFPTQQGEFSSHYQFAGMTITPTELASVSLLTFFNPVDNTKASFGSAFTIELGIISPFTNGRVTLTDQEINVHTGAYVGYTYVLQKK